MFSTTSRRSSASEGSAPNVAEWEMRPGGMLVQKRSSDANQNTNPLPTIRVRVKHGSLYHEIRISPQASFGNIWISVSLFPRECVFFCSFCFIW